VRGVIVILVISAMCSNALSASSALDERLIGQWEKKFPELDDTIDFCNDTPESRPNFGRNWPSQ
jgi:hypothetical protein